jgi:hypothetical protein
MAAGQERPQRVFKETKDMYKDIVIELQQIESFSTTAIGAETKSQSSNSLA